MGSVVKAMDQIVAQQVCRESQKNKGWQQQGRTTTTVPFLKQSSDDKKAYESIKTQQSTTKMEVAGRFGCWKKRQCFEADGRGLGAG
jgi:hypothetical protein